MRTFAGGEPSHGRNPRHEPYHGPYYGALESLKDGHQQGIHKNGSFHHNSNNKYFDPDVFSGLHQQRYSPNASIIVWCRWISVVFVVVSFIVSSVLAVAFLYTVEKYVVTQSCWVVLIIFSHVL
jgi:hypothetical protein